MSISLTQLSTDVDTKIRLTDLTVSTDANGASGLAYDNVNGVFTFTPPDLSATDTITDNLNIGGELQVTDTVKVGDWTITINVDDEIAFMYGGVELYTMNTTGVFLSGDDVQTGSSSVSSASSSASAAAFISTPVNYTDGNINLATGSNFNIVLSTPTTLNFSGGATGQSGNIYLDTTSGTATFGANTLLTGDTVGTDLYWIKYYQLDANNLLLEVKEFNTGTITGDPTTSGVAPGESVEPPDDETAPTIQSTTPNSSATGTGIDDDITIVFDESIDSATVSASTVTFVDSIGATVSAVYSTNGGTITINPIASLSNLETYTVTVTTGIQDTSGNALASPHTFSFTTAASADTTPPTVQSTTPSNSGIDVAINSAVTIVFDESMDANTISASTITMTNSSGTPISSTISLIDATVTLTPDEDLDNNEAYTVSVTTSATDLAGNNLQSLYTFSFVTIATVFSTTPSMNSLYFDGNNYLSKTPSAGDQTTWTWSSWVKRTALGEAPIFSVGTNAQFSLYFGSDDNLRLWVDTGNASIYTNSKYRDTAVFYHIVLQSSNSSPYVKLYVNGAEVTSFSTDQRNSFPGGNAYEVNTNAQHLIGAWNNGGLNGWPMHFANVQFIDGEALGADSFGEYSGGSWIPKAYSGTYGTNGFYLDFKTTDWNTTGGSITDPYGSGVDVPDNYIADNSGQGNHWEMH